MGDAGLYLLPERARQPQLATSLVAPAAAVCVDVRRRWLLAAPAGIFRCMRCCLAAVSSNYSPILGIAPRLDRRLVALAESTSQLPAAVVSRISCRPITHQLVCENLGPPTQPVSST